MSKSQFNERKSRFNRRNAQFNEHKQQNHINISHKKG